MSGKKRARRGGRGVSERAWIRVYRTEALRQQKGKCVFCLEPLTLGRTTAEHVNPRAKGGSTSAENIAAACQPCNSLKANMSEKVFRNLIRNPDRAERRRFEFFMANARFRIFRRMALAERRIRRAAGLKE
ncbi:HNH endonuclease [Roseibium sp. RKSG952]|uniref:HNH endonuclease n=1 Tax=Roseibium sp. RKSG952 TaxID=2529384 RepID=UPI0012BC0004|nr:HNH endonuclease signature motif containing protein [Roseibium sp. RKSG952]